MPNTTMIEQLRDWASDLEESAASVAVYSIVAGMREVAKDLEQAPSLLSTPYEVVPFRTGRSKCGQCDGNLRVLRPTDEFELPSFFLCTECDSVGQVGVARLWPVHRKLKKSAGYEVSEGALEMIEELSPKSAEIVREGS